MKELKGKRIKLIHMTDPYDPIEPGATGTVINVVTCYTEHGEGFHIDVDWDPHIKRSLALLCPPDEIEVIDG